MSYPIFPEKYKLTPLLSAGQMIDFRRKHGGLGELKAPDGVILCLYKGVMKRFAWKYPSRHVKSFLGDLYLLKHFGGRVGVMGNFGIGSPALTSLSEEMIAWGAKNLVILSLAGGLQPDLQRGSIVICDRAIRDEGTSYHYLPPERDVKASLELVSSIEKVLAERKIPHTTGATWSTDAPYRETREEAELFQSEGVKVVDMESAGLFAAAQVNGITASSAFIIGDSLAGPRWSAPPDMRALHLQLELLLDVLIEVLEKAS